MTRSKELIERIAALRSRLDAIPTSPGGSSGGSPGESPDILPISVLSPPHRKSEPTRLTYRASQLLKDARNVLAELKALGDDPLIGEHAAALKLHRESAAALDAILRNLASMPEGSAAQLRHCEGLSSCLDAVREQVGLVQSALGGHHREDRRIDDLSGKLLALSLGRTVDWADLLTLARTLADEALDGAPFRIGRTPKQNVARFVAHHGLATARVLAYVLRTEIPHRQRLAERLVPALIHDVGMIDLPEEVVFSAESDVDLRLFHQHPIKSRDVAARLYPGGGAPVDAVADHHERTDGSGYPNGKFGLDLGDPARLLAVCDVYAALSSDRPHRPAFGSRTALADILAFAESGRLDRAQSEKLMRLTFYPPGSVVLLSDGGVALVVSGPRAVVNPAKAVVVLLRTAAGRAPAAPWPIDLAESNSLHIVRTLTADERVDAIGRSHPSLT